MKKYTSIAFALLLLFCLLFSTTQGQRMTPIKVSPNGRYFVTADGKPFFWLGDTGWLLFTKLTREQTDQYLEQRKKQGFNVIQVMVLHGLTAVNVYGDAALNKKNTAQPRITPGNSFSDTAQYDYWDHVDYVIDKAAEKGLYIALVPVWGSNVKSGGVSRQQATAYATFLATRYRSKPNIVWMDGGDIKGSDSLAIWKAIGSTLHQYDPYHLITYHPMGRTPSSQWFHNERWLSFNMFQSGHRRYEQDTSKADLRYGEDNWKYVNVDYALTPVKPTIDGEPSYEGIPQGLHDTTQPYWNDNDVRRYAYWSVFAGAAGFTYGHNAVMQFYQPGEKGKPAYGAKIFWTQAVVAKGASQMQYLKQLMLSKPYLERVPDQSLIAGDQGEKYNRLLATRGKSYAFIYTYNGRLIKVQMGKIAGAKVKASWFSPRDGSTQQISVVDNKGVQSFDPPGDKQDGNDWVLVLEGQ
jgi:hypothetical protein